MANLGDLNIEISANAKKATTEIDALCDRLTTLSNALGGLSNLSSLSTLADGISKLSSAMSGLKGGRTDTFQRLATNISTLNQAQTNKLGEVSTGVLSIGVALGSMEWIDTSAITSVADSINKLGSTASQTGIGNLKTLATDLNNFATELSYIPNTTAPVANIANVVNQIRKLGTTVGDRASGNFMFIAKDLVKFVQELNGLELTFDTTQLTNIINSIAQLGKVASGRGVYRLPIFAENLEKLFKTLAKSPQISNNIVRMTQALSGLTANLGNVRGTSQQASIGLTNFGNSAKKAHKSTLSLASAFGKFYATFFLLIRGLKAVGKGISKAMNAIEVENYFENAMKQVGRSASIEAGVYGTDSANAYIDNFVSGLKTRQAEITDQMSGYKYNEDTRMLERTNTKNLGLSPNELMQYQAQFMQMADSMGASADNAEKLSNAYIKLGADLASIRDVDFSEAWSSLSSGMVGMSKVMDKFGINIRVAALNEQLANMGIDTTVAKLNAEDKALLRTIVMLDRSRGAWTDLSRTLESPANQFRILQNNLSSLGMAIGNILLSGIARVLPYINALVKALQTLMQWIIRVFGIQIPEMTTQGTGIMEGLYDSIEDTAGAMDDASSSAKKLKNNLLGIDELNVISKDTGSNGGGGGLYNGDGIQSAFNTLYDEYMKAWDDAYKGIDDKIQSIADKIINAFKSGDFKGIGKTIADMIKNALQSIKWDSIFKGAEKLGSGWAKFLNGLLDPDTFYEIGKALANAINTVFHNVASFVANFDWKNAGLTLASLVNGFVDTLDVVLIAHTISEGLKGALRMVATFLRETDFKAIGEKIGTFLKELDWVGILNGIGAVFWNAIGAVLNTLGGLFKADPIIGIIATALTTAITLSKFTGVATKIGTTLASVFGTSTAITGAGQTIATTLSTGATSATAQAGATAVGGSLGGWIIAGVTAAIAGFNLGEYIYTQWGGDESNLLSNNWGNVGEWLSKDMWDFDVQDNAQRVDDLSKSLENYNTRLHDVSVSMGYVDFESFSGGVSKTSDAGKKIIDDIEYGLGYLGYLNVSLGDYNAVANLVNSSMGMLSDTSKDYILTLASQYDSLTLAEKTTLSNAYGVELLNSDLQQLGGNNGMPSYVAEIMRADENQKKLGATASNTTGQINNLTNATTDTSSALSIFADGISTVTSKGHNGMPSYIEEMQAAEKATKDFATTTAGASTAGMPEYAKQMSNITTSSSTLKTTTDEMSTSLENSVQSFDTAKQYMSDMSAQIAVMSDEKFPALTQQVSTFGETVATTFSTFDETLTTSFEAINTSFEEMITPIFDKKLWEEYLKNVTDATDKGVEASKKKFEDWLQWSRETFEPYFSLENFNLILSNIPVAFEQTFTNACRTVIDIVNRMIDAINASVKEVHWDAIEVNGEEIVAAGSAKLFEIPRIQGFEMGGYPDRASLFFMNENGNAEMLGNIGGRQAVVNNDQIVQAVSVGVENAVSNVMLPYLSQIADNTRETADKEFATYIGDREITKANIRGQRAMGRTIVSTT